MNKKVDEKYKCIKDVYILQCICSELKSQLQQKENIIKEVREYIDSHYLLPNDKGLLEILDKVGNDNERDKDNK